MGITLEWLDVFRREGLLKKGGRILDIGSSNLYQAPAERVRDFILHYEPNRPQAEIETFAGRLADGSGYDPEKGGTNNAFAGELLHYCGLDYLSFDIAKGYKTRIFDLNREDLRPEHRGAFDVVLNIGTTEHVLNQYNSFKVIHEAARAGGYIVHQLPVAGFTDHAYFVYTGRMFYDLAGYNKYEILNVWYEGPAGTDDLYTSARAYKTYFPKLEKYVDIPAFGIPNCSLTVILRKAANSPFVACLETSTSVGSISSGISGAYRAILDTKLGSAAAKVKRGLARRLLHRLR